MLNLQNQNNIELEENEDSQDLSEYYVEEHAVESEEDDNGTNGQNEFFGITNPKKLIIQKSIASLNKQTKL
ncbi:hypothetical protein TTHERM_001359453 (macronuclear) [Tetrahymena thermophila SB210]|uniref:Uncharacterized protein n=1 Tax=Tetrahymena thermophila (strain SB210) TaxID=312017 RepID=W7X1W2_TETTS|nr:hypothetical protein TTHERM_001359453 [Tetrahymena thermophila SB210]EWS73230.1 hypothetical protein TTHERM_001359453 [Tetrahymena thermophila SB210]|eukprot:XP_012654231.1 hypothetical protein TTHERM_001359453 [Tetrahymena thermophila SB210]